MATGKWLITEIPKLTRSPQACETDLPIPKVAQYLDRKVRLVPDLNEVWEPTINPFMLYGRHMGFRTEILRSGFAERDPRGESSYLKVHGGR